MCFCNGLFRKFSCKCLQNYFYARSIFIHDFALLCISLLYAHSHLHVSGPRSGKVRVSPACPTKVSGFARRQVRSKHACKVGQSAALPHKPARLLPQSSAATSATRKVRQSAALPQKPARLLPQSSAATSANPSLSEDSARQRPGRQAMLNDSMIRKWRRLGKEWQQKTPVRSDLPSLGSWLEPQMRKKKLFLTCKCCNFVNGKNKFEIKTKVTMQMVNIQNHANSKCHKQCVQAYLDGCRDACVGAPSEAQFGTLCDCISKREATLTNKKDKKMTFCISEAIKAETQSRLMNASSIGLFRDERKGKLDVRYSVVTKELEASEGFLGRESNFGTGALKITTATGRIFNRVCKRFHAAPHNPKRGRF